MEKQFGWACKLGGAESLGLTRAGQIVLARLMEFQIWHQLAGTMRGGCRKGTMASAHLDANTSVSPCVPLVPFKLLPWCWSSEGVSLSG